MARLGGCNEEILDETDVCHMVILLRNSSGLASNYAQASCRFPTLSLFHFIILLHK